MGKFFILGFILFFLLFQPVTAQNSIKVSTVAGFDAFFSGGDQAPLWMVSRQQGRWNLLEKSQVISYSSVQLEKRAGKSWVFKAEAELDYSSGNNEVYLHTGNIKTSWRYLTLTAGRHLFSPIFESHYSGSGSYLFGDNNRPITRITIGIPQYTKFPFPYGRLELKGEISHGDLNDGVGVVNHNKVLLHEKYAYVRWDGGKWLPYAGLNHSVFMGGYSPYEGKITTDYWKSFFAKGSQKIGGGDATNAAGAHMGLYDFGFYRKLDNGEVRFFYQIPFADKSGMLFWKRNIDQIVGLNFTFARKKLVQNLTVEWINTAHQTGNGIPDVIVIYPDGSSEILPRVVMLERDLDELMARLGHYRDEPYQLSEVMVFLQNEFNRGRQYGGRDGYLNNGMYPAGWTYKGSIMGSPLNLTRRQVALNNPNLGDYFVNNIINDRIKAIHLGGYGSINDFLKWKGMVTYSVNYGSYYNKYPGRYTWYETENYYFKDGLKQFYSLIEINWQPSGTPNFEFSGSMSFDVGEIFNSYGAKISTRWYL